MPDEVEARVTTIDEEIGPIVSRPFVYQPTEMTRAGPFVSIDVDGSLYVERGYIRPEDELAEALIESDGAGKAGSIVQILYDLAERYSSTGVNPGWLERGNFIVCRCRVVPVKSGPRADRSGSV